MSQAPDQLDENKVLVVEDNKTTRTLTVAWLPQGVEGIGLDHKQYPTIETLAEEMRKSPALSAILDGELPGKKTAVDLIKILHAQGRKWAIVVHSANDAIVEAVKEAFPAIPAFVKASPNNGGYPEIMEALEREIASAVQRSTY